MMSSDGPSLTSMQSKRKSKFDVPPELCEIPGPGLPQIAPAIKRKSNFDIPPESLVSLIALPEGNEFLSCSMVPSWSPVTDLTFTERLQRALKRNFEYLIRKENQPPSLGSGSLCQVAHGEIYPTHFQKKMKSLHFSNHKVLGAPISTASPTDTVCLNIYVSGLPTDISEEELDILFSSQGKIKKIKIYVDSNGRKKGDALITYFQQEHVNMACLQFNNLNIGEGYIISVVRADFGSKSSSGDTNEKAEAQGGFPQHRSSGYLQTVSNELNSDISTTVESDVNGPGACSIRSRLPQECEAELYPVVLLWRAYDPVVAANSVVTDPNFFIDLEADLLIECCKFGKVIRLLSPESQEFDGCVAVTFAEAASARACASSLYGRWFDGRQIEVQIVVPNVAEISGENHERPKHTSIELTDSCAVATLPEHSESVKLDDRQAEHDVVDVEDFLNSLL